MNYDIILKQHNILIGGSVGSGKSFLINSLIRYSLKVENACYIFLDPKRVELRQYNDIRECISYADSSSSCTQALNYTIDLIEKRYINMQKHGFKKSKECRIYLVIDELADIFINDKRNIKLLQKILQIGRASNICVIAATQCVHSAVIPTALKTNFTCKIALRVQTPNESRLIVNVSGAESLPKYGYCILLLDGYTYKEKVDEIEYEPPQQRQKPPIFNKVYEPGIVAHKKTIDYQNIYNAVILVLIVLLIFK